MDFFTGDKASAAELIEYPDDRTFIRAAGHGSVHTVVIVPEGRARVEPSSAGLRGSLKVMTKEILAGTSGAD